MTKIVNISKKEAFALKTMGIPYGENGITHTTSRHSGKSYLLCESKKNMELLKKYRDGIITN